MRKHIHDKYSFFNDESGSSVEDPMVESKQELWVRVHQFLILLEDLPMTFFGLFLRSWVGSCYPLASPSLWDTGTGFDGRVTHRFVTRRPGQNRDGQNRDVRVKVENGRDKDVQGLHLDKRDIRFKEKMC
jgi:hypothetical protein